MWRLWLIGHETCCALVYPCNGRPVDLHTICLCVAGVTCTQFACVLRVQVFSFGACEPRSLQHLAARITALEQLPWSKMIPSREIVQCRKESCKTVVLGKLCATLLIWYGLSTPVAWLYSMPRVLLRCWFFTTCKGKNKASKLRRLHCFFTISEIGR